MPEGKKAPHFSLPDQTGKIHKLSDYKTVVLYFYPKDDTPGCAKEACNFRDHFKEIKDKGAVILGVSADTEESHQKFADKYNLPFPLLADTDKKIIKAYDAWQEKSMYGKKFMGIMRSTAIIKEGIVTRHWQKVKGIDKHWEEVLEAL